MLESHTENGLATWTVEECSLTVEYSLRVIDDIRLAVVDAFFSLPRGGAEIGGILLGRHAGRRVTITGYAPLDCEHATGPSFVLSPNDHTKLADLMASARGNPMGTQPVGWYHSHTRSEIHLSAADIEIHKRYFPELWQVALVLKPHTFQPARAGFFFRGADGSIHGTASYKEFVLEPLGVRALPDPSAAAAQATVAPRRPQPEPANTVIPMVARPQPELTRPQPEFARPQPELARPQPELARPQPELARPQPEFARPQPESARPQPELTRPQPELTRPQPEFARPQPEPLSAVPRIEAATLSTPPYESPPETEPETRPETIQVAPPAFTQSALPRSWGGLGILIALSVGLAFGAGAYQMRQLWLPRLMRLGQGPAGRAYVGLTTLDTDGQLQIRWDRDSPAVRDAEQGSLVIEDGAVPQAILLDPPHLRTGAFTYGRQTERVDIALTVHGPAGQTVREVATYLGKLPARAQPDATKELRGRTKKLEKTVEDLRQELHKRKRMSNQSPESVK
jgi:proteasome lid subunit RPN8/RPN11